MNHSPDLRLAVTLRLLDGEGQRRFGPGVAALLEEVREKRSLRAAAASMGMAYSKAWRIVRTAEEALGHKLLDSTIGGRHGGGGGLACRLSGPPGGGGRLCPKAVPGALPGPLRGPAHRMEYIL
jgi:hypothetical protein